jgi:7,8-dihydropterin-6-yl-methyl-4-(beta-D-ribofuranosyl)aminobenzene 5'-phosphate synthase
MISTGFLQNLYCNVVYYHPTLGRLILARLLLSYWMYNIEILSEPWRRIRLSVEEIYMEVRMIRLLSLVENTAEKRGLLGEHGLAVWIEAGSRRVLFDTGQGLALPRNALELGIDLHHADAVVLSHGHNDHTGGLGGLFSSARKTRAYAHPGIYRRRFVRDPDGTCRESGIRDADAEAVRKNAAELVEILQPTEVMEGLFVTGPVPRLAEYEDTGGAFSLDRDCLQPDPIEDDQALFFESNAGVVVLLGCAHAGVVNTLEYVRSLTGGKPIHAVVGGMHLKNASRERLERTYEEFRRMDISRLHPGHCTGIRAVAELWQQFPGRCGSLSVGTRMEFP